MNLLNMQFIAEFGLSNAELTEVAFSGSRVGGDGKNSSDKFNERAWCEAGPDEAYVQRTALINR